MIRALRDRSLLPRTPFLGPSVFIVHGDSSPTCDYLEVLRSFEQSGRLAPTTVFRNEGRGVPGSAEREEGRA